MHLVRSQLGSILLAWGLLFSSGFTAWANGSGEGDPPPSHSAEPTRDDLHRAASDLFKMVADREGSFEVVVNPEASSEEQQKETRYFKGIPITDEETANAVAEIFSLADKQLEDARLRIEENMDQVRREANLDSQEEQANEAFARFLEAVETNKVTRANGIGKTEMTMIDGQLAIKAVHTNSRVAFVFVSGPSVHLRQYIARQHVDAGARYPNKASLFKKASRLLPSWARRRVDRFFFDLKNKGKKLEKGGPGRRIRAMGVIRARKKAQRAAGTEGGKIPLVGRDVVLVAMDEPVELERPLRREGVRKVLSLPMHQVGSRAWWAEYWSATAKKPNFRDFLIGVYSAAGQVGLLAIIQTINAGAIQNYQTNLWPYIISANFGFWIGFLNPMYRNWGDRGSPSWRAMKYATISLLNAYLIVGTTHPEGFGHVFPFFDKTFLPALVGAFIANGWIFANAYFTNWSRVQYYDRQRIRSEMRLNRRPIMFRGMRLNRASMERQNSYFALFGFKTADLTDMVVETPVGPIKIGKLLLILSKWARQYTNLSYAEGGRKRFFLRFDRTESGGIRVRFQSPLYRVDEVYQNVDQLRREWEQTLAFNLVVRPVRATVRFLTCQKALE